MNNTLKIIPRAAAVTHGGPAPRHIAIVMDGNGRWAARRGRRRVVGHRHGLHNAREVVRHCARRGVRYLTLFAFSSENWRRPADEVQLLMGLIQGALETEVDELHKNNIRLRVIGNVAQFKKKLRDSISAAETLTAANDAMHLSVAANYGGHWDLTEACRSIAMAARAGALDPVRLCADTVERFLSTRDLPPPDLFIRTGGEKRLSNFLLWQVAYTELFFSDVLWPDFGAAALEQAIADYNHRQRRYGRTAAQVAGAGAVGAAKQQRA